MKALIEVKVEKTPQGCYKHLHTEMRKIVKTIYVIGIPVYKHSTYLAGTENRK